MTLCRYYYAFVAHLNYNVHIMYFFLLYTNVLYIVILEGVFNNYTLTITLSLVYLSKEWALAIYNDTFMSYIISIVNNYVVCSV